MDAIKLTVSELNRLESIFDKILYSYREEPSVIKHITKFKQYISNFKSDGTYMQKDLIPEMPKVINDLKPISDELSKLMANQARESCKSCIFHVETCIINVYFIVFKSLEVKKYIDFKNMRPSLRILM